MPSSLDTPTPTPIRYEGFDSEFEPESKTWLRKPEDDDAFGSRVEGVINRWKSVGHVDARVQSLVFTHSLFISRVLSSDKGRMFHLMNGSITILDIDEDENIHVQISNYTQHLRTQTGGHF